MAEAGNFNRLQRAREQAFYAEATLNLARAQQAATSARERLTRLLGLWEIKQRFALPERLPELPVNLPERVDLERTALTQRLDVLSAKFGAERTARNLGLTRTTRFLNLLDLDSRARRQKAIRPILAMSCPSSCRCLTGVNRVSKRLRLTTCRRSTALPRLR